MDLLLDNDGDLKFKNNDLVMGQSENQHIQDIVESSKGDYKFDPFIGVDAERRLSGSASSLEREIIFQLRRDGYRTRDVRVETIADTLNVYTNATRN